MQMISESRSHPTFWQVLAELSYFLFSCLTDRVLTVTGKNWS